jgi:hypothetical protein
MKSSIFCVLLFYLFFKGGINMNKRFNKLNKTNKKNKDNIKNRIIKKQIDEISSLKEAILELEVDYDKKCKLYDSVDAIRSDLIRTIEDLKNKEEEYDKLIKELTEMKNTMNQIVFKRKWKLIQFLLK